MKTYSASIDEVLTKNVTSFFIPPFQRAYAWGRPEIERFFDDLIRLIKSELNSDEKDKLEHFFGTLVFKQESQGFAHKFIVIDGQQRLTTTLLFLIALRDIVNEEKFKNSITELYLKNNHSDFEDKIKLNQVTKDWDAYKALVNGQEAKPGAIQTAYQIFNKLITHTSKANKDIKPEHYILALDRMNVAIIFLDERPFKGEDPQIIFETLNSLGKPLTLADLVRNFILFSLESKKQSNLYEERWYPQIEKQLKGNISKFYRDYLQYKTASSIKVVSDEKVDSNTKEVYQIFKDFVEKENKFNSREEFVNDIIRFAPLYKMIVNESVTDKISSDSTKDKEIKELLRNIFHDIRSEAFKPFVLGLLEYHQYGVKGIKLSDEKLIEILKNIRTYLIRRRILGLTQGENKKIVLLCNKISMLANSQKSMIDLLSDQSYRLRFPNDNEVSERLKSMNFYNELKDYSKFILGKIEENNAKVAVDFRKPEITIEHIMPQTLSDSWKNTLGNDWENIHKNYLHNIGNLILTEFNSEMGNMSFEQKKEKLKNSSLNFRLDIINRNSWTLKDIEEHRTNMITWFLKTFPLPEDFKYSNNWKENVKELSFSPLDNKARISKLYKPAKLIIDNTGIAVATWQDIFIEFLKWIKNSNNYDFGTILENQKKLFCKKYIIIKWKDLKKNIQKKRELGQHYKTFDGSCWDSAKTALTDELLFIHIYATAKSFRNRIANVMKQLNMTADFVKIELLKIKQ